MNAQNHKLETLIQCFGTQQSETLLHRERGDANATARTTSSSALPSGALLEAEAHLRALPAPAQHLTYQVSTSMRELVDYGRSSEDEASTPGEAAQNGEADAQASSGAPVAAIAAHIEPKKEESALAVVEEERTSDQPTLAPQEPAARIDDAQEESTVPATSADSPEPQQAPPALPQEASARQSVPAVATQTGASNHAHGRLFTAATATLRANLSVKGSSNQTLAEAFALSNAGRAEQRSRSDAGVAPSSSKSSLSSADISSSQSSSEPLRDKIQLTLSPSAKATKSRTALDSGSLASNNVFQSLQRAEEAKANGGKSGEASSSQQRRALEVHNAAQHGRSSRVRDEQRENGHGAGADALNRASKDREAPATTLEPGELPPQREYNLLSPAMALADFCPQHLAAGNKRTLTDLKSAGTSDRV